MLSYGELGVPLLFYCQLERGGRGINSEIGWIEVYVCWIIECNFFCVAPREAVFKAVRFIRRSLFGFLLLFLVFLWQQSVLDLWQHTTSWDSDSGHEFVQLLVVPHCQLKMSWDNPCLLVVPGSIACQFQYFGSQVFQYSSHVNGSTGSDAVTVVTFSQETMDSSNWKLQSSSCWPGLWLSFRFSAFSSSRHNEFWSRLALVQTRNSIFRTMTCTERALIFVEMARIKRALFRPIKLRQIQ